MDPGHLAGALQVLGKTIVESAATVQKALDHSTTTTKLTIENSSEFLIATLKVSTDTAAKNASEIKDQIAALTASLSQASTDVKKAGDQSAALSRGLNWLTGIIAIAAIVSAGATGFYAWETMRQVDLLQQQLQNGTQRPGAHITGVPPK